MSLKSSRAKKSVSVQDHLLIRVRGLGIYIRAFFGRHWKGTLAIGLITLVFFWPLVTRISSYDVGGDASFNAWTLARNHHCLLRDGCPNYADGNIYFPHKDTMLYSETQLSAGLLTLPLYLINNNPLFAYNIWTILSFFLAGWFMYLLAKRLSRGDELISILAGLIFAFAPFKLAALFHLQNQSIFYLPLAVLLIIRYLDTKARRYMAALFVVLALLFYASWYQMAFALIAITLLLGGMLALRLMHWKRVLLVAGVVGLAALSTAPLALEFMRFSKENNANFSIKDQVLYSSSVADYFIPHDGTLLGKLYYHIEPGTQRNAYNLDSFSYHGVVLYVTAVAIVVVGFIWYWRRRKQRTRDAVSQRQEYKYILIFLAMIVVGFIISLGPLLKIKGSYLYTAPGTDTAVAIAAPWLAVDKFLPQLQFIRAIGRASVIMLFALCAMLAFLPAYLRAWNIRGRYKKFIMAGVVVLVVVELLPVYRYPISAGAYTQHLQVPAVYTFIKDRDDINNIVILRSVDDYPGAPIPVMRAEDVLWAGYHNKNIFNGYSGYTPPLYFETFYDFVLLEPDDIPKMQKLGLRYVLIDKQLSAPRPFLMEAAEKLLPTKVYEDERYVLRQIPTE